MTHFKIRKEILKSLIVDFGLSPEQMKLYNENKIIKKYDNYHFADYFILQNENEDWEKDKIHRFAYDELTGLVSLVSSNGAEINKKNTPKNELCNFLKFVEDMVD